MKINKKKIILVLIPALLMGIMGGSIGIAAFGTAISGFLPFAIFGGVVSLAYQSGFRITKKSKVEHEPR